MTAYKKTNQYRHDVDKMYKKLEDRIRLTEDNKDLADSIGVSAELHLYVVAGMLTEIDTSYNNEEAKPKGSNEQLITIDLSDNKSDEDMKELSSAINSSSSSSSSSSSIKSKAEKLRESIKDSNSSLSKLNKSIESSLLDSMTNDLLKELKKESEKQKKETKESGIELAIIEHQAMFTMSKNYYETMTTYSPSGENSSSNNSSSSSGGGGSSSNNPSTDPTGDYVNNPTPNYSGGSSLESILDNAQVDIDFGPSHLPPVGPSTSTSVTTGGGAGGSGNVKTVTKCVTTTRRRSKWVCARFNKYGYCTQQKLVRWYEKSTNCTEQKVTNCCIVAMCNDDISLDYSYF
jgi:hypothetical protein